MSATSRRQAFGLPHPGVACECSRQVDLRHRLDSEIFLGVVESSRNFLKMPDAPPLRRCSISPNFVEPRKFLQDSTAPRSISSLIRFQSREDARGGVGVNASTSRHRSRQGPTRSLRVLAISSSPSDRSMSLMMSRNVEAKLPLKLFRLALDSTSSRRRLHRAP